MYGNPIEELNSNRQKGKDIKANSISVSIESRLETFPGKVFKKKLLGNMLVGALKTLCSKLLKTEVLAIKLSFLSEGET